MEYLNKKKKDRLDTGDGVTKLLGAPMLENGSRKSQSDAVFDLLNSWNIQDKV